MKTKTLTFLMLFAVVLFTLPSCGGGEAADEATNEEVAVEETPAVEEAPVAEVSNGEKLYKEKCIACHLETGEGMAGAFPPLAGSDYLKADKVRAITQVMRGSEGEITVNGAQFNGVMPPQVDNAQDAVDVTNYILSAWGNDYGTVTLEDVPAE